MVSLLGNVVLSEVPKKVHEEITVEEPSFKRRKLHDGPAMDEETVTEKKVSNSRNV